MNKIRFLAAALVAVTALPAAAAVTVIGSSSARLCFEAADSPMHPSASDLRRCDEAFLDGTMSRRDEVATHVNRGILRLRRNAVPEAIADFDAAIALDPQQPEAYLNKGAALIRQNDPAEALRLFTVALDYDTRRPEIAHYGRAIANEELGNVRAAYLDYRRASELDPDWDQPRAELRRFSVRR